MMDVLRRTLVVLGVGLLASLAVGLIYGAIIDDVAEGLGRALAIGMSVTAVIGVAVNLLLPAFGTPRALPGRRTRDV